MEKRDWYSDISNTASSHDCTGLMPSLPQDNDEREAYKELAGMAVPKD
ncbi:MAG TPA: hypothetical protein PKB13_00715 [Clostridia bacterium]|nr:hypothetical protein [Clostridia bacterium]